jgi:uncharacterized protein YfaS (alpha-2-macroglobulin family)
MTSSLSSAKSTTKRVRICLSCLTPALPQRMYLGVLVILTGLCFWQCSDSREVKVIGKNFGDEVSTQQNLVITFNQNLWSEQKLEVWEDTEFLRFEPALSGKFRWTAANELVFSPTSPLAPATEYRAYLTEKVLSYNGPGEKRALSREAIAFHTPFLTLQSVRSWWILSPESGRPEAQLQLSFNYPIDPANLRERLKVMERATALAYRVLPSTSSESLFIALADATATEDIRDLEIQIGEGAKIEGSSHVTTKPISNQLRLSSPLEVSVTDVSTGFQNSKGYIQVHTSQGLVPDQIASSLSIEPKLPFRVEATENGFVVKADFLESETYVLRIGKGLKGVLGQALREEVTQDFFFGKMPESIQFVNRKAQYLSTKGNRNIGIQITNVPNVQVKISKVYDNNLLYYLYNRRYENYAEMDGNWGPDGTFNYSEDYDNQYSDVLVNKKVVTDDLPKKGGVSALNVSIPEVHGKMRKGVYLVQVASSDAVYLSAQKLVSVSDIGLIAKQGKDEVWVFANSIHDATPLKGVEIVLVSTNNQEMHRMKTDGNGVAHLAGLEQKAPGFRLAMVTASLEEDFNYLHVSDARVETSRFEVEGARSNPAGIQAFVYGERDVYRPGETLNFVAVVRSDDWKPLVDFPLKLKLVTPNGQSYGSWVKNSNKQGAVEVSVKVEEASLTGAYTLEVYNGSDVLLSSAWVNVEEFVPDRIKVDLNPAKSSYRTGENVVLEALAVNLFGPPAANRNFEMEYQLQRKQFRSKDHPDYSFEIPAVVSFERIRKQGVTTSEGKALGEFLIPPSYQDMGMLEGKIYVTVFDENGRPVNRLYSFEVATQSVLFGIRMPDRYVGVNVPVQTDLLAVDPSGKLKTGESAEIEVVRVGYQTVIEKRNDRMQYTSKRKEDIVYRRTIKLAAGTGSFRYTPVVSGEYEVRVKRPGAQHYTSIVYHAYGYGFTQYSSFEVSSEGRVLIETDKEKYRPGEKAKILFKAPFDGNLLVTVEQGEVLSYEMIPTKNKAAEISLPVSRGYLPNVYVTATLIRAMNSEQIPLTVAHGFAPMRVEAEDRKLDVAIVAQEASRSKKKQRIRIQTQPHAQVSVGVVDEGILQIRNFATPDIYGHFYRKRALEVTTADLYAWLFPELDFSQKSSSGGDGLGLTRRINPLGNGNRELVRFWSGLMEANSKGEVNYEIDLPQFSGSLRVMAVAFKDQAFGSASKNIQVADPLVISAGVPRFVSPGDELALPVTLTNTQKQVVSGSVAVDTEGEVQRMGAAEQPIQLLQEGEGRILVKLKASNRIGPAKIVVKAKVAGESFVQEYRLHVRPASPLLKIAQSGVVEGGEEAQIHLNRGLMEETSEAQLVLGRSPLVQGGGKALSTLIGYPHGCLEQTISKAFPQMYYADLTQRMARSVRTVSQGDSDLNPAFNVQQAIRKVESLHLFNGGFAMWPGSVRDDWWVSAYAVQFLDEARRAGFEVNASVLSAALSYLTTKSGKDGTEDIAVTHEDGSTGVLRMASTEAIYSLYVLAAAGKPNRAMMNYYKQHPELLHNDTRYLLAGAYHYIGDPKSYASLLPKSYEADGRFYDRGYLSPLSGLGIVLNMLIDTDPQNLQVPVLARQLSQSVASANSLNTQEAVFAVLALGKLSKSSSASTVKAEVFADGKKLGSLTDDNEQAFSQGLLNGPVRVKTEGKGKLYWFSETSGFDASGVFTEEDDGLKVRRYYLDRNGRPVREFKQNDLVVVKITLASTLRMDVPNVVVTDLLPAGFEVENPRLTSVIGMPWVKNAATPDYFDIRDDRIHYFVTASPAEKTYYYQVRVTSPGVLAVGPVAADAMYQTHVKSYSSGGKIRVN